MKYLKLKLVVLLTCLLMGITFPLSVRAWGLDAYGWGKATFTSAGENTYTMTIKDAGTGSQIQPDELRIWLTNPGLGIVAEWSCNTNCPSTVTLKNIPSNIRIDHNSRISKLGYHTAESPGGVKLDPSVPTNPPAYNSSLLVSQEVFLAPDNASAQFEGTLPSGFDYYSYIPEIKANIRPMGGSSTMNVYMFNYKYNQANGSYEGRTFGPFNGAQTVTLGLDPGYPDSPMVRLDSYVEDTSGNRSSWGTFVFGLDRVPPSVYCSGSVSGNWVSVNLNGIDNVSGVSQGDVQVSTNGGSTWSTTNIPNGGNTWDAFTFKGTPGTLYKFRFRARDSALNQDGSRGQWSGYTQCQVQLPVTATPKPLTIGSDDYSIVGGMSIESVLLGDSFSTYATVLSADDGVVDVHLQLRDNDLALLTESVFTNQDFNSGESKDYIHTFLTSTGYIPGTYRYTVQITKPSDVSFNYLQEIQSFQKYSYGIHGKVFFDINKNEVQELGEVGYPGITVEVTQPSDPSFRLTAVTDNSGFYNFIRPPDGDYVVKVLMPDAAFSPTSPDSVDITADDTSLQPEISFGIFVTFVGAPAGAPSCTPLIANPSEVNTRTGSNTAVLSTICTDGITYNWEVAPSSDGVRYGSVSAVSSNTNLYVTPTNITVPFVIANPTVVVTGLGGSTTLTTTVKVNQFVKPWVKTGGGDVHSNGIIDLPGGL